MPMTFKIWPFQCMALEYMWLPRRDGTMARSTVDCRNMGVCPHSICRRAKCSVGRYGGGSGVPLPKKNRKFVCYRRILEHFDCKHGFVMQLLSLRAKTKTQNASKYIPSMVTVSVVFPNDAHVRACTVIVSYLSSCHRSFCSALSFTTSCLST